MRRLRTWLKPRTLPLAIGASILVMSWSYLMWNTTVGELIPSLRFRTKNTIAGIVERAAPLMSLDSVLTGRYQQWVSRSVGELSPMFKPAIGWKNEIYYSLLGATATPDIVVGKRQQLFEMVYLAEYCSRDLATLRAKAEDWAARIRQMQDFFEARGKTFVYVITPSKVAREPQIIPDGYTCVAPEADRDNKLKVYGEILSRHGVHFVDTASKLGDAEAEYGISMFPRGGTHWNALAAALGANDVIGAVDADAREPMLRKLNFTWRVSLNPKDADRDLIDLLNLPHPDLHYPVPELTYDSPTPEGCKPVSITEVGGSFVGGLNAALEKTPCPPRITYWFYWDQKQIDLSQGHAYEFPVDPAARRRSLLDADVILFEENEQMGPGSTHGTELMKEVAGLAEARR